jgi:hypothetical protein
MKSTGGYVCSKIARRYVCNVDSETFNFHADGFCYIVGLKSGDETHLHDLLNPQEWLKTG